MDEQIGHVDITANRLRMVQVDFADESEQVRREYLAEEIQRTLAKIAPDQRQAFLQELMSRFPSWDHHVKAPPTEVEPEDVVQSLIDRQELQDPSFLMARLAEITPNLSEEQKKLIISGLQDLKLTPPSQAGFSSSTEDKIRKALTAPEAQLDPDRMLELTVLLTDFAGKLEPLVWRIWRTLAPHSTIRRPLDLKNSFSQFCSGDQLETYNQLASVLEMLRQLIAALVSAVGQAGNLFAQQHAQRFSPHQIEAVVKMEHPRGKVFQGIDVLCWRKYKELADRFDAPNIESEIRKAIADGAEALLKGAGH